MNPSLDRFVSIHAYPGNYTLEEFNELITNISLWLLENLKPGIDYEWSIATFSMVGRSGMEEYPVGIFFNNESDITAFKLRFKTL